MCFVYVIKSLSTGKIYIGRTDNIANRLKRHNQESTTKKTSYTYINQGPWILVYKEGYKSRKEAIKREKYLKSHVGRDWLKTAMGP